MPKLISLTAAAAVAVLATGLLVATPAEAAPVGHVTNVAATAAPAAVRIHWSAPPAVRHSTVVIVQSIDGHYPTSISDGWRER